MSVKAVNLPTDLVVGTPLILAPPGRLFSGGQGVLITLIRRFRNVCGTFGVRIQCRLAVSLNAPGQFLGLTVLAF